MRFSLMICVYNAEPFLCACVQSVLAQTYSDFELLLLDDGSTDGSGAICNRFAENDKRVRVLHTDNRGVLLARAAAEAHARGDYLLHFDADDTVQPDLLQTLSDAIDRHAPDLLFYDYSLCGADGSVQVRSFGDSDTLFAGQELRQLYRMLLGGEFNTLCNKCFHRRLTACAPVYLHVPRLLHGEDLFRSAYLVAGAQSAYYIHRSFYNYRTGVGGSGTFHKDSFQNYAWIAQHVQKLLREKTEWDEPMQSAMDALCRRQIENLVRALAADSRPLPEKEKLLQSYADTDFFRNALRDAPNTLKFRLLRSRRFRMLLAAYRIKGARHAQ